MTAEKIHFHPKVDSFKYEWRMQHSLENGPHTPIIESFSGKAAEVTSPYFSLDDDDKWNLGLFVSVRKGGKSGNRREYKYGIGLWRAGSSISYKKKRMRIQCTIVADSTKEEHDEINIFRQIEFESEYNPIMLNSGFIHNFRDKYSLTLTVICYFHIMKNNFDAFPIIDNSTTKMTGSNLSIAFAKFFNNKKLTDITFILDGDKKIQAHKVILISRSRVFEVMFESLMKEQTDNVIEIEDIKYEVFEEMLRYIYTDDVSNLKSPLTELLHAAEKYELEDLKETCGRLLGMEITVDNAAVIYICADRYNLKVLSSQTQCFVREHLQDFVKSLGYDRMVDEYPDLAKKIFK